MAPSSQVIYRDAFMGTIQKSGRILDPIRFPLVITVSPPNNNNYLPSIRYLLEEIYCSRGTINVISQLDNKMRIMFSHDQDAIKAYQELHNKSVQHRMGIIIAFKIWHPMDDLGYDVADHQIYISIEGLPLHLWKKEIVEQILHPYCALEQLSEETRERRNLSSYTAFSWSQQRITIPTKINLKVTRKQAENEPADIRQESKEVTVYRLFVRSVGYLCDSTTNCSCNFTNLNSRYEGTYDPDNAQCFLTEIPDNQDLLKELSYGVLATTLDEHHGCQKEEMQDMVSAYLTYSMKVHRLNSTQFIILPSNESEGPAVKTLLLEMKYLQLHSANFILDHWTETNMSMIEKVPFRMSVTITEIPAHLCTPRVIRFILSPYCAVETDDANDQTLTTSEKFTCIAWGNSTLAIPKRIMAALFSRSPQMCAIEATYPTKDLRITQMLIDATYKP